MSTQQKVPPNVTGRKVRRQRKAMVRKQRKMQQKNEKQLIPVRKQRVVQGAPMGDERSPVVSINKLQPQTVQPAIQIEVPLDVNVLYGACVSYVSAALSRGYLSFATNSSYPYFASVYMVNVLLSYIKATVPGSNMLPLWLQNLGQALAPKTVPCDKGHVFYRFVPNITSLPWVPPANTTIGSTSYGYEFLLYVTGTTNVDLFPVAVAPGGYTEADGAAAWASLAGFMRIDGAYHTEIIPLRETTWKKNVSAFGFPAGQEGLGYGTAGGQAYQAGLEVPVHNPVLSVFANFLTQGINPSRYARFTNMFGGDACFAASTFYGLWHHKWLGTKRNPKFHAIDFLQFGDVLAQWVAALQQKSMQDNAYVATLNGDFTQTQCPITLQEFLLIVRNEMMSLYNVTQVSTQSIYPRAPASDTNNEFVPYICGSNTVGLGTTGVKIPMMLAENMKSLVGRMVLYSKGGTDPMWFSPILGQYALDVLDPADYTFETAAATPAVLPSFAADPPTIRRRRNSKGETTWLPEVEAAISFIDGTSGSSYYFINDQTRLKQLTALWNQWITRFQTYSMKLTTVSFDVGVNICTSIGITRHWIPPPTEFLARNADTRDVRLEKRRGLTATPYANRLVIAESSHAKLLSAPYDLIQKMWILPVNKATAGLTPQQQSVFVREQIMQGETYSVSLASENGGVFMSNINFSYAQAMVRGTTGTTLEIEDFFDQQSKNGSAGPLSGFVAGALGKLFGPTIGSISGTVAEMLPI